MAKGGNTISKTAVWILLALLIVGLAGFGATNLSGTVRTIGSVGQTQISTTDYFRALDNDMRRLGSQQGRAVTLLEAQALGLPDQVLSQLVISAALEEEARRIGLSVGDLRVAEQLQQVSAFQGVDGSFDREAYRFALENVGLNESEFEEDLRADSASTILQGAVLAGASLPDTYIDTILAYTGETRSFTWAALGPERLETELPAPTDTDLRTWYDDNIDRFTLPTTRDITYVWVTPDMILDSVEVSQDVLRAAYEEQEDQFNLPERRLVERLVFGSTGDAQTAADAIAAGDTDFETLVADRGLDLADTDLGDVTRDDLEDAAGAVFDAEIGAVVVGPSDLGPAIFRVNAVLAAQNTPFDEAVPLLRDALALAEARRIIDSQAESYNDELAAGATLEDLADATDLTLGQIGWTGANADAIAAYPAFAEAAQTVSQDDFPEIDQLGDGGLFALRLNAVRPPEPQPFEDVRDAAQTGWQQAQTRAALVAQAETLVAQLGEGRTLAGLDLETAEVTEITRSARPQALPTDAVTTVFEMTKGEARAIEGLSGAVILYLDAVSPADPDAPGNAQLAQALSQQADSDIAEDLFRAMANDIQARLGVEIDRAAINAVHANFQ